MEDNTKSFILEQLEKHRCEETHKRSSVKEDIMKISIALVPFLVTFFIYISSIDKRLTIIERTVPTRLELQKAVSDGVKEAIYPLADAIKENQKQIINLQVNKKDKE